MTQSPTATLPARPGTRVAGDRRPAVRRRPRCAPWRSPNRCPGFPGHRAYALVAADASGLVFWLQSVAPDGPRFLAVPAAPYFPDYAPAVPPAACAELGPGRRGRRRPRTAS